MKNVNVYRREKNGDYQKEDDGSKKMFSGMYGINIHRSNSKKRSSQVNKWSAGCQVFADPDDFSVMLSFVSERLKKISDKACATYTLIDKEDIPADDGWKGVPYTMPEGPKSPFNGWDNPIVGDEDSGVGWSGVRPMEEPKEE